MLAFALNLVGRLTRILLRQDWEAWAEADRWHSTD